jgi:hypothetical protein
VGEGSSVSLKGVTWRQYWGWIKNIVNNLYS